MHMHTRVHQMMVTETSKMINFLGHLYWIAIVFISIMYSISKFLEAG